MQQQVNGRKQFQLDHSEPGNPQSAVAPADHSVSLLILLPNWGEPRS